MSIFCSLIREECNTFHSQSTVKTLESASQLPYRHITNIKKTGTNKDTTVSGDDMAPENSPVPEG